MLLSLITCKIGGTGLINPITRRITHDPNSILIMTEDLLFLPLAVNPSPRRVAVVGVTGSGKTRLAQAMAEALGLAFVELDALQWEPGWKAAERSVFRQRAEAALACGAWVTDGNYSELRDLVWRQAQVLVWLDYALPLVLWRLLKRTLNRTLSQELLWGTNRETWRGAFFSRDSLFLYALASHKRMRRNYPAALALPEYAHLTVLRLHTPRQAEEMLRWLNREYVKRDMILL